MLSKTELRRRFRGTKRTWYGQLLYKAVWVPITMLISVSIILALFFVPTFVLGVLGARIHEDLFLPLAVVGLLIGYTWAIQLVEM